MSVSSPASGPDPQYVIALFSRSNFPADFLYAIVHNPLAARPQVSHYLLSKNFATTGALQLSRSPPSLLHSVSPSQGHSLTQNQARATFPLPSHSLVSACLSSPPTLEKSSRHSLTSRSHISFEHSLPDQFPPNYKGDSTKIVSSARSNTIQISGNNISPLCYRVHAHGSSSPILAHTKVQIPIDTKHTSPEKTLSAYLHVIPVKPNTVHTFARLCVW